MIRRQQLGSSLLILLLGTAGYCETPSDWDNWRGPDGNSIVYEKDWNPGALRPQPKYVWRARVGFGYSAVSIKGDYLYSMGNDDGIDTVFCPLVENGREAKGKCWTAPVFCRGRVYCRNDRGEIACIDLRD